MQKQELIQKVRELRSEGHSLTQIAKRTGFSLTHIKNINRENCIPMGVGNPDKDINCESCSKPLKGNQMRFCSQKCKLGLWLNDNGKRNYYHYQKTMGIERKKLIVKMKGGCCEVCGYNKSSRALTFHHREPKLKSFHLNLHDLSCRSMELILEELKKCDLLCFNCHMELHERELLSGSPNRT